MMKTIKTIMVCMGVIGTTALTLSSLSSCTQKQEQTTETLRVTTETVGTTAASAGATYVGTVEGLSSTACSFTGMGTITKMCVSEGQTVQKGQLLAQIDDTQCRNALATCEAQMRQANDALARMKQLHESNSISDMKWVEVQSQVDQARSSLDMAKKALRDCNLYAPVSGVIGSKMANSGETALPSQPVCSIVDISAVKVKVSVPEKEIALIHATTHSVITVDALGKTFHGGRIEKGIEADALTHTYNIKIGVANAGRQLLPGMVCQVSLDGLSAATAGESILTVPVTAVQQDAKGEKFVWVVKNGKAHRQTVAIGSLQGNRIAVTSGLAAGDKIITEGYQKVSEGSEVKE